MTGSKRRDSSLNYSNAYLLSSEQIRENTSLISGT